MASINLDEFDFLELKKIALFAFKHDPLMALNQQWKKTERYNYAFGYTGKTINNMRGLNFLISDTTLSTFFEKIDVLEEIARNNPSTEATYYLEKAKKLKLKIDIQLEKEKSTINDVIYQFAKLPWFIYEKTAESIVRNVIRFSKVTTGEKLQVKVYTTTKNVSKYTGFANTDTSNNFLFIQTSYGPDINSLPTNYIFIIDGKSSDIDLSLGLINYIDPLHYTIITKNVILEKIKYQVDAFPLEIKISDLEIEKTINHNYLRLLTTDSLEGLEISGRPITNLEDLKKRYETIDEIIRSSRNENILGSYNLFCSQETFSRENQYSIGSLIIVRNIMNELIGTFYHKDNNRQFQEWQGKASYSMETECYYFTLQNTKEKRSGEAVFLMLFVPLREEKKNILIGSMSGLRKGNEPPSFGNLVMGIQFSEKEEHDFLTDEDISRMASVFFNIYKIGNSIITPPKSINNFADLKNFIKEKFKPIEIQELPNAFYYLIPYIDDFETISNHVKIEILNRIDVSYTIVRKILCIRKGANEYHYRFAPTTGITNFTFYSGKLLKQTDREGGRDYIVQLGSHCTLGEERTLTVKCEMKGVYTLKDEDHYYHKQYRGMDEGSSEIIFPKELPPLVYKAEIIGRENYGIRLPKNLPTIKFDEEGRQSLVASIEAFELQLGEKLYVSWTWDF